MTASGELSPAQWAEARRLFDEALERGADERAAWLEQVTADALIRTEVTSMLAGHDRVDEWFVEPPSISAPEPDRIAGYRIVRELASGGMGRVYEAEGADRTRVALKIIRPGLLSTQALRRFRREAESLARLEHPAIARVFAAGAASTDEGEQPYIAMELVDGERLDRYLERAQPALEARIEMLAAIADGVQHAHERGVVHRDLKPGNVLVDTVGKPRIVDFGVARLLGDDATMSQATITGQLLGTLPYMSPEQIAGGPSVDGRTDVYALGVVGFEMLTGSLPYDVRDKPVVEAVRIIDADEPTRLSSFDRELRGDLETIVGMALAKEPDRRYPSARALANDLRRWARGEPIEARRPGTAYQLQRFARRNRGLVAGLAVAAVVLVAGTVVSTTLAIRATRSAHTAHLAEVSAAEDAATARRETARAARVQAFLESVLAGTDPRATGGSVHAAVTHAAARIDDEFADDRVARIIVLGTISDVLVGLGDLHAATECAERAWAAARDTAELDEGVRAATIERLAERYRFSDRLDEAAAMLDVGIASVDPMSAHAARLVVELGRLRESAGRHDDAARLLRRAFRQLRDVASAAELVAILGYMVESLSRADRLDEALPVAREAIELAGLADSPTRQSALGMLIQVLRWRDEPGDLTEAEATAELVLGMASRLNDPTAMPRAQSTLAAIRAARGDLDGAVPMYRQAIDGKRAVYGEGHYEVAQTADNLAVVLEDAARFEGSIVLRRETLAINRRTFGIAHERTRRSLFGLVDGLTALDQMDEARTLLQDALAAAETSEVEDVAGVERLLDGARRRLAELEKVPESGDG